VAASIRKIRRTHLPPTERRAAFLAASERLSEHAEESAVAHEGRFVPHRRRDGQPDVEMITETRTVKAVTVATPGGMAFPHAQQAVRITRTRTIKGKTSRGAAYLTMSLPADQAQPADLGTWARSEWQIENRLHYVRDVTLREDAHQARTGNGPAVFATLRNTSIGYHRTNGATNIAEATRRANHRPHDLIDAVTRGNPTVTRGNPTTQ
jgi:predicted transposase YbfD/YdcC